MKKKFKINSEIKSVLQNLVGVNIVGLYAPQCIRIQNQNQNDSNFLGKEIFMSLNTGKTLVLEQYEMMDSVLINDNNNLKLSLNEAPLVDLQPFMSERGFYLDFIDSNILRIDLFGYLNLQQADNEFSEICIVDESGEKQYFIDIKCSYVLRFFLKNQVINLTLDNERFFPGNNDFVSRFKLISNDECEKLLDFKPNIIDEYALVYEKIFTAGAVSS